MTKSEIAGSGRLALGLVGVLIACAAVAVTADPMSGPPIVSADDSVVDPSFGAGGTLSIAELAGVSPVAVASDPARGQLIVLGSKPVAGGSDFVLVRLDEDGSVDPGFGADGVATVDLGTNDSQVRDLEVGPDGSLLFWTLTSGTGAWSIVKLTADGVLDASFASGGRFLIPLNEARCGVRNWLEGAGLRPDGSVWFVQRVEGLSGFSGCPIENHYVGRLTPNGQLDETFGGGYFDDLPGREKISGIAGQVVASASDDVGDVLFTAATGFQNRTGLYTNDPTGYQHSLVNLLDDGSVAYGLDRVGDRVYVLNETGAGLRLQTQLLNYGGYIVQRPDNAFSGDGQADPLFQSPFIGSSSGRVSVDDFGNAHVIAQAFGSSQFMYRAYDPAGAVAAEFDWDAGASSLVEGVNADREFVLDSQSRPVFVTSDSSGVTLTRFRAAPEFAPALPMSSVDAEVSEDGRFMTHRVGSEIVRRDLWAGSDVAVQATGSSGAVRSIDGFDVDAFGRYVVFWGPTLADADEIGLFRRNFSGDDAQTRRIDVYDYDYIYEGNLGPIPPSFEFNIGGVVGAVAGREYVAFTSTSPTVVELINGEMDSSDRDVFTSYALSYNDATALTGGVGQGDSTAVGVGWAAYRTSVVVESTASLDAYDRLGVRDDDGDSDIFVYENDGLGFDLVDAPAARLTTDRDGFAFDHTESGTTSQVVAVSRTGDVLFTTDATDLNCAGCAVAGLFLREKLPVYDDRIVFVAIGDSDRDIPPGTGYVAANGRQLAWLEQADVSGGDGDFTARIARRNDQGEPFIGDVARTRVDGHALSLTNSGRRLWARADGAYTYRDSEVQPRFDRPLAELLGQLDATRVISDPVNVNTGALLDSQTDLELSTGSWALSFSRTYDSLRGDTSSMGPGWRHGWSIRLDINDNVIDVIDAEGRPYRFVDNGAGWDRPPELLGDLTETADGYDVSFSDGVVWSFDTTGLLVSVSDSNSPDISLTYNGGGELVQVSSATGETLTLLYDLDGRIASVSAANGRTATYDYDTNGALVAVTRPSGDITYQLDDAGLIVAAIDATGIPIHTTSYDSTGRVVEQALPNGERASFVYDDANRATTVTDLITGEVVTYTFNGEGRISSTADPNGEIVRNSFNDDGQPTSIVDRRGVETVLVYDDNGQLVEVSEAGLGTANFEHDDIGRMTTMTDGAGAVTRFSYEGDERLPSAVTDGLGNVTTYDVRNGVIHAMTDADGVTVSHQYDAANRVIETTNDVGGTFRYIHGADGEIASVVTPDGGTTTYTRDIAGRILTQTSPAGTTVTYTYDDAGRPLTQTDPDGGTTTNTWNAAGQLATVTDPIGRTTTYRYDELGQLTSVTDADGKTVEASYGTLGRLASTTDEIGRTTNIGFDIEGNLDQVTTPNSSNFNIVRDNLGRPETAVDAAGRATSTTYDQHSRIASVTAPDGGVSAYTYDTIGRIDTVTDAEGGVTSFTYTAAGRLNTATDPTGVTVSYSYDDAGRLTATTNAVGASTNIAYDVSGRRTSMTTPAGLTTTWTYDTAGRPLTMTDSAGVSTTYTYNARGEVASQQRDGEGASTFTYRADGTIATATDPLGNTTTYNYDNLGRLTTRTAPDGATERWEYNAAGEIVAAIDALGNRTDRSYDDDGRLRTVTDPTGRAVTYTYNPTGDLTASTYSDGTQITYTYDAAGRRASMNDPTGTTTYDYDLNNRLFAVNTPQGQLGYSYDAAGRRTSTTYPDSSAATYTYDDAGRLARVEHPVTGPIDYTVDPGGTHTATSLPDGTRNFDNSNGRLNALTDLGVATSISYNQSGRVQTLTGAVNQSFDYDAAGQLTNATIGPDTYTYAYTPRGQLATATTPGRTRSFTHDARGGTSIIAGTDGNGNVTYDAAGRITTVNDPDGTNTSYTYDQRSLLTEIQRTVAGDGTSEPQIPYPEPDPNQPVTGAISPIFECWTAQPDGTFTAYFGYENRSVQGTTPVGRTISHGNNNKLTPTVFQGQQPERFGIPGVVPNRPGRTAFGPDSPNAFVITGWNGSNLVWKLGNKTATASNTPSKQCNHEPSPPDGGELAVTTETRSYNGDGQLVGITTTHPDGTTTTESLLWDLATNIDQLVTIDRDGTPTNYISGYQREYAVSGTTATVQPYNIFGDNLSNGPTPGPYGENTPASGTSTLGYRNELITPTGSIHLRARTYLPELGAFNAIDPLDGVAGTTPATNPYHYAYNDPINRTDPTGLRPTDDLFAGALPVIVGSDNCAITRTGNCINIYGLVSPGAGFYADNGYEDIVIQQANLCANTPELIYWKTVDRATQLVCNYFTDRVDPNDIQQTKYWDCTFDLFDDHCWSADRAFEKTWDVRWDILKFAVNVGTLGAFGCGYDGVGGLLNNDKGQFASGAIDCVTLGIAGGTAASSAARSIDGIFARVAGRETLERAGVNAVRQADGTVLSLTHTSQVGSELVPQSTVSLGKWGEARLGQVLAGTGVKPSSPLRTSLGNRYIDRLVNGIGYEAKAGLNVGLTSSIRKQVLKDAELVATDQLRSVEWHFFRGAQDDLLLFLKDNGIDFVVHQ